MRSHYTRGLAAATPQRPVVIQSASVNAMRLAYVLLVTTVIATAAMFGATAPAGFAQPARGSPTSTPPLPQEVIAALQPKQDDDDGPDVLLMALLTTGAAAGAAVLGLAGYVIRNRIGFWLHRPPPREGGEPEEHH